ncbi:MAG: hypothetical protein AAB770_00155 [Patescibacteria group bacterium]
MKLALLTFSLCVLFVIAAVTQSDLRFFVPAASIGLLALFMAYYDGKGQILTEKEMGNVIYAVECDMILGKRDVVIVRTKTGKLRACISPENGFDLFAIKGDRERFLVPKNR